MPSKLFGPHRAFSLFLFNSSNELLLQQRSAAKVTFPLLWTNTCCSHPRHTEEELGPNGVQIAAVRRAEFELGIKGLKEEHLRTGAKILYYSKACERFAEWELDHIIFAKDDLEHDSNIEEIKETAFVSRSNLNDFLEDRKAKGEGITPWFEILLTRSDFLKWWELLEKEGFEALPQWDGSILRYD